MSSDGVKPLHFWLGTALTLGAVIVNIWQTNSQIRAQRYENQLTQIATVLKDISSAIGELSSQLESQASMYIEMQGCLANETHDVKGCWNAVSSFDPAASTQAWRNLDSIIAYSGPFLVNENELKAIDKLRGLGKDHQTRIRAIIPPKSSKDAQAASDAVLLTQVTLNDVRQSLVILLSQRVRSNE